MSQIDASLVKEAMDVLKNSPWYNSHRIVECECGYFYPSEKGRCPHCGARMDGKDDGKND